MPGRILIADDSPSIRRLVRGLLEYRGYQVLEAGTGEEAQQAIDREGETLSLAILDLRMPRGDGLDVLARVRAKEAQAGPAARSLPVLILTAEEDEADHARDVGANCFLIKPFEPIALLQIVQELTG